MRTAQTREKGPRSAPADYTSAVQLYVGVVQVHSRWALLDNNMILVVTMFIFKTTGYHMHFDWRKYAEYHLNRHDAVFKDDNSRKEYKYHK